MKGRRVIHELNESGSHLWHTTPHKRKVDCHDSTGKRPAFLHLHSDVCRRHAGLPRVFVRIFVLMLGWIKILFFFQNPPSGSQLSSPCAYFPLEGKGRGGGKKIKDTATGCLSSHPNVRSMLVIPGDAGRKGGGSRAGSRLGKCDVAPSLWGKQLGVVERAEPLVLGWT